MDSVHMPTGCATWPAFWSNGPNWPAGGEIDIVEGVFPAWINVTVGGAFKLCPQVSTTTPSIRLPFIRIRGARCHPQVASRSTSLAPSLARQIAPLHSRAMQAVASETRGLTHMVLGSIAIMVASMPCYGTMTVSPSSSSRGTQYQTTSLPMLLFLIHGVSRCRSGRHLRVIPSSSSTHTRSSSIQLFGN